MKKIFLSLAIIGILCCDLSFAQDICGIGVKLIKDPYNKKVFILKVLSDYMSEKYSLKEGMEIISVDNKNVKELQINEINNLIRGLENTKVKLNVKYFNKQYILEIPRTKLVVYRKEGDFESYWNKVKPSGIEVETISQNILINMSKSYYNEIVPNVNYWVSIKSEFKEAYEDCLELPDSVQNTCLDNLIIRTNKITKENNNLNIQNSQIKEQPFIMSKQ